MRRTFTSSTVGILVLVGASPALALQFDATWNGVAGNWSGGVSPNNLAGNSFSVFIDGGNLVGSIVTLDVTVTITSLSIDSSDRLHQLNGRSLVIAGGSVVKQRHLGPRHIGIGDRHRPPRRHHPVRYGQHRHEQRSLPQQPYSHRQYGADPDRRAYYPQLLVGTGGMVNAGTIIADQPNGLDVDPNALGFVNLGLMRAAGGNLRLARGMSGRRLRRSPQPSRRHPVNHHGDTQRKKWVSPFFRAPAVTSSP